MDVELVLRAICRDRGFDKGTAKWKALKKAAGGREGGDR